MAPASLLAVGALMVLVGVAVAASWVALPLFLAAGAGVLAALAYLALRHPRATLATVALLPIADRYLVALLVPAGVRGTTNLLSEAALVVVAASVGLAAWRRGSPLLALRHPVTWLLGVFVVVAGASAVVNGVPPLVAGAGIGFTVDAALLFILPRLAGFGSGAARVAVLAFGGLALAAAGLALCQVVLAADFLGLESFTGRFSEGHRVASFLVNPNMLGAVLAMATPFAVLAAARAGAGRARVAYAGAAFVLMLALLYTFSRGAWLGLGLAMLVVALAVEWRALALLALLAAMAVATALVLPRHVLDPQASDVEFDLGAAIFGRLETLSDGTDLRLRFIENAAPIVGDHPALGAGPGRYGGAVAWRFGSPLYAEYTAGSVPVQRTVDNFWLHLVVEVGVLGAAAFVAALAAATWTALRGARRAAGWPRVTMAAAAAMGVVIAVGSLTEMLLEGNTTSFVAWFFLGAASVLASTRLDR